MASNADISWGRIAVQAIVAGNIGGLLAFAYLWLTRTPVYGAGGIGLYALAGTGWAAGYAYFATTRPATNARWPVAGIAYGIVVYGMMQLVMLGGGLFASPSTPNAFVNALVAHTVFFGLPVAFIVNVLSRYRV